ncbi:MAG: hypothetical protein Q9172_006031 [Xanthocarpia lactea]
MPRTRAAQRSQASPEDSDGASQTTVSATPSATKRAPLGQISGNREEVPLAVDEPEVILKANKGAGKGKKGKSSKQSKKAVQDANNDEPGKVLPDERRSEMSPAVDDACQDLLSDRTQVTNQMMVHEDRPSTPPSPAAAAATQQLSSLSALQNSVACINNEAVDQSTRENQATPVPTEQQLVPTFNTDQMPQEAPFEGDEAGKQGNDAPRMEKIQSPTVVALRPEDSIAAIDKFEEEMEKVGDLIPSIKNHGQSPKGAKETKQTSIAIEAQIDSKGPATTQVRNKSLSKRTTPVNNHKLTALVENGAAVISTDVSYRDDTNTDPKIRKTSDSPSTSEKRISVAAKKRVSSVHKAPFVPAKSTKPPTRANFELPGEAVARRLKEAREGRLKSEGEDKDIPKKTTFKARPVRLSQAPIVKPTATSNARISMAKGENPATVSTMKNATPMSRATRVSHGNAGKRLSTLSVNKRLAPTSANTSARLSRGPSTAGPNSTEITKSRLSMQPSVRQSITTADTVHLKAKGKEVFNRGRIEQEELDKMKKGKEEAAKKARAEAAEKGRIASRQWAEKQKAKKIVEKKGTTVAGASGKPLVSA